VTALALHKSDELTVLLIAEGDDRASFLNAQLAMIFPRVTVHIVDQHALAEGRLPPADIALIDGGAVVRGAADSLRLLRGHGFTRPIVLVTPVPDDSSLHSTAAALGATRLPRDDANPISLGTALASALDIDVNQSAALIQLRRTFAAGQMALSLQHGINNPLAALLAEAQLMQLEELTSEQRASVDRMVELCRRIVTLVRRLDVLGGSAT
jgi:signal transduction histidine kinase